MSRLRIYFGQDWLVETAAALGVGAAFNGDDGRIGFGVGALGFGTDRAAVIADRDADQADPVVGTQPLEGHHYERLAAQVGAAAWTGFDYVGGFELTDTTSLQVQ